MQEVVALPAKADTPQGLAETEVIPFTSGGGQQLLPYLVSGSWINCTQVHRTKISWPPLFLRHRSNLPLRYIYQVKPIGDCCHHAIIWTLALVAHRCIPSPLYHWHLRF